MAAKTPARPPTLLKSTSSASSTGKQQKSILGFFAKTANTASSPASPSTAAAPTPKASKDTANTTTEPASSPCLKESSRAKTNSLQLSTGRSRRKDMSTPVPSNDAVELSSSQENHNENGGDAGEATPKAKVCGDIIAGLRARAGGITMLTCF